MDSSTQSIQVKGREPRRRFRSVEEKRRIVEETLKPGASVARVARAHEVNANQVFVWRRQYADGQLEPRNRERAAGLLAVRVVAEGKEATQTSHAAASGTIQIELPRGTIRIVGIADAAALQMVLEYLTR